MAWSRSPRLGQHFWILDRYLVNEVVHRGPAEALDDVFLIAVDEIPLFPQEGLASFVEPNDVDDECLSFPMADGVAVVRRIGVFLVGTAIERYHAKVVVVFQ